MTMTLAKFLEHEGCTQSEFAKSVETDAVNVHRWVKGQRIPRPEMMARIVEATNGAVTPASFYPAPHRGECCQQE